MTRYEFHVQTVTAVEYDSYEIQYMSEPPPFAQDDDTLDPTLPEWWKPKLKEVIGGDGNWRLVLQFLLQIYSRYGWEHYTTTQKSRNVPAEPENIDDTTVELLLFFRKPL